MNDHNEVNLRGFAGGDPETFTFSNGDIRVGLSLATSDRWKNDKDEPQTKTQWHRLSVLNQGLAKIFQGNVRKGDLLDVRGGKLEYRDFTDKEGVKRSMTEIVLRNDAKVYIGRSKGPE